MLEIVRIIIQLAEIASAVISFILAWFMMKPYRLTGEGSFLGLPLGFGIMGASHVIATAAPFSNDVYWFMVLFRTFSFLFLATTYFFSKKSTKKTQHLWNITLSALIVVLIALSLLLFAAPQFVFETYGVTQIYWRIFMVVCVGYIAILTLLNHIKNPGPMTIWIPFGFLFLAISQVLLIAYTLIFTYIGYNITTYWAAIVFRFAGFIIFLIVAYRTFYSSKESKHDKDFP